MPVRIILTNPETEPQHLWVAPPAAIPVAHAAVIEFPDLDGAQASYDLDGVDASDLIVNLPKGQGRMTLAGFEQPSADVDGAVLIWGDGVKVAGPDDTLNQLAPAAAAGDGAQDSAGGSPAPANRFEDSGFGTEFGLNDYLPGPQARFGPGLPDDRPFAIGTSASTSDGAGGGIGDAAIRGGGTDGDGADPAAPGNPRLNDGDASGAGDPGNQGSGDPAAARQAGNNGNNGVGNGEDPAPPGNPPLNDGEGTGPGDPGNRSGGGAVATGQGGGDGGDVINGTAEDDVLAGGLGDDILAGGGGDDTLTGGPGADGFAFAAADLGNGVDSVTDFNGSGGTYDAAEGDLLDLSDLVSVDDDKSLDDYVHFADDGSGNVNVHVDPGGAVGTHSEIIAVLKAITVEQLGPVDDVVVV